MLRLRVLFFVALTAICLTPLVSLADDFAPPPWSRLSPFAITAEWEFLGPADPAPPDGPLTNVFLKGSGSVPTLVDIVGAAWGGTNGGNWFFPSGGEMRFTVDNIIDHEPIKYLRVQVTSTPDMVLFIDPLSALNASTVGSTAGPVSSTTTIATGPFGPVAHTLFTWEMYPNPPWERFNMKVSSPGEIRQIVVDTISTNLPEPATFVVYGVAVLLAGMAYWKRPAGWTL